MTLSSLAESLGPPGRFASQLWRPVAFLGRYGNQPVSVSLGLPVDDLRRLVEATAKLLEEEHKRD